jgi:hypothetical protein
MSVTSTTMTIDAHFNAGAHSGTERFEAWLRNTIFGTWTRKLDTVIGGVAHLVAGPVINLPPGVPHDVACRLTRSGAAQAGSTSADPMDWPAGHRQMGVQLLLDDPVDDGSFIGDALGAPGVSMLWCAIHRTPSDSHDLTPHGGGYDDPDWPDIFYEFQWSAAGAGTWAALNGIYDHVLAVDQNLAHGRWYGDPAVAAWDADIFDLDSDTIGMQVSVESHHGTTIDIRLRRVAKNPVGGAVLATSGWLVLAGEVIPA